MVRRHNLLLHIMLTLTLIGFNCCSSGERDSHDINRQTNSTNSLSTEEVEVPPSVYGALSLYVTDGIEPDFEKIRESGNKSWWRYSERHTVIDYRLNSVEEQEEEWTIMVNAIKNPRKEGLTEKVVGGMKVTSHTTKAIRTLATGRKEVEGYLDKLVNVLIHGMSPYMPPSMESSRKSQEEAKHAAIVLSDLEGPGIDYLLAKLGHSNYRIRCQIIIVLVKHYEKADELAQEKIALAILQKLSDKSTYVRSHAQIAVFGLSASRSAQVRAQVFTLLEQFTDTPQSYDEYQASVLVLFKVAEAIAGDSDRTYLKSLEEKVRKFEQETKHKQPDNDPHREDK